MKHIEWSRNTYSKKWPLDYTQPIINIMFIMSSSPNLVVVVCIKTNIRIYVLHVNKINDLISIVLYDKTKHVL